MAIRVLVPGSFPDHEAVVKSAISFGYGSDISSQILVVNGNLGTALAQAAATGAIAAVYSYGGLPNYIAIANVYYPGIQSFMPLGSNSPMLIGLPTSIPLIVTCGAGDSKNDTAYGPGLEFWDDDNDGDPNVDASSFSNGTICGKLLKIKDTKNCSWWEARFRARKTATNGGIWDQFNGYGKIDVTAALAYAGGIDPDPYFVPPPDPPPVTSSQDVVTSKSPETRAYQNRQLETIFQTFYSSNRGLDPDMLIGMQKVLLSPTGSFQGARNTRYVSQTFQTGSLGERMYNTIQSAIDAAAAVVDSEGQQLVLVFPGNYDETLVLRGGVNLAGIDRDTCVLLPTTRTDFTMLLDYSFGPATVHVSNLRINSAGDVTVPMLRINALADGLDLEFADCAFINGGAQSGITLNNAANSKRFRFDNCYFQHVSTTQLITYTGSLSNTKPLEFANCYFKLVSSTGNYLRIENGQNIEFRNSTFFASNGNQVAIQINTVGLAQDHPVVNMEFCEFIRYGTAGVALQGYTVAPNLHEEFVTRNFGCNMTSARLSFVTVPSYTKHIFQNCFWKETGRAVTVGSGAPRTWIYNSELWADAVVGGWFQQLSSVPYVPKLYLYNTSAYRTGFVTGAGLSGSIVMVDGVLDSSSTVVFPFSGTAITVFARNVFTSGTATGTPFTADSNQLLGLTNL